MKCDFCGDDCSVLNDPPTEMYDITTDQKVEGKMCDECVRVTLEDLDDED